MKLRATLAKSRVLSFRQMGQIPMACLLLLLTKASLKSLGLARTQRFVGGISRVLVPTGRASAELGDARSLAKAIDLVAGRRVIQANCLVRSLVLWAWLRARGRGAELRFGIRKNDGEIAAHAWVELAGEVINDSADVAAIYLPFDASITAGSWA